MIKRLKTKYGVFLSILVLFSVVVTLSYSAFIFSTDKYRSTELLISKLNYGITITEDKTNLSSISGSKVTVPKGSITYYNIVISSINKIDSKYTLAYKTSSNAVVKYTDRTPWNTSGYIKGYDENTYSKRIRVVIDNSSSTTSSTVDFAVYGGYTFNTYASIELNSGYVTVTGPYTEELASLSNRLVDIVENDTGCVTSESSTCLYGGDSIKNYVQYPTNEDKTKNIWRILGSYIIDGETVTKMIKVDTVTNLDNLYNTLTDNKSIILSTNKFNCFSSTCNTSDYTNIGILTNYEYNQIGGNNSYLQSLNPFLVKTENGFNEVTDNGINEGVTSSNLKPVVYIQTEVQTSGSGTSEDPYTLTPSSDINLVAYTLNGQSTTKTYAELLTTNVVKNVTCKNGTVAKWDNTDFSIKLKNIHTPDYCTIDFTDGYTVTLTANTATVNPSNVSVGYGGSAKFTVTPNDGFKAVLQTNTCRGTLSGNTYTISNITSNKTCSISLTPTSTLLLYEKILADNPTIKTRTNFNTTFTETNTGTLYKATESIAGNTPIDVYYFVGDAKNNWVKFGTYASDGPVRGYYSATSPLFKEYTTLEECNSAYSYNTNCSYDWRKGDPMYWRIIRTNHDGSIRLLYSGASHNTIVGYIGTSVFNTKDNNPMYVGYMYGTSGSLASNRDNTNNSTIKTYIDNWYNNNLSSYSKYISTEAVYCNDRELTPGQTYGTGSMSSGFSYVSYGRIVTNKTPTYHCANIKDSFSGNNSEAKLIYPIGLMTADEIAYAGGKFQTNLPSPYAWYYLNSAGGSITGITNWWSLSPETWVAGKSHVWLVAGKSNPGYLSSIDTDNGSYGARPVISLKTCIVWTNGNGAPETPYEISLDPDISC